MATGLESVVQAEFFPEIGIRKTCVRFYDVTMAFTKLVNEFGEVRERGMAAIEKVQRAQTKAEAERVWTSLQNDRYSMDEMRARAKRMFFTQILNREYALELTDRSFRKLEEGELDDLFHALFLTKGIWLFVFEPNDLLADKNKLIGSLM